MSAVWRTVDTGPMCYPQPAGSPMQGLVLRHCTTWMDELGRVVSVVVEHAADVGMAISHPGVAQFLRHSLASVWGSDVRIFEWWYPGTEKAFVDEQYWTGRPGSDIGWRRVSDLEFSELPDFRRLWVPGRPMSQNLHIPPGLAARIEGDGDD